MTDYLDNSNKQMKLAMMFVTGYGNESYAWRFDESNERAYTDTDNYIKLAKIAEQGKIHTPVYRRYACDGGCCHEWRFCQKISHVCPRTDDDFFGSRRTYQQNRLGGNLFYDL